MTAKARANTKCLQCGHELKQTKENRRYLQEVLDGVTLVGVDVWRCSKCGEEEVAIPRIEELHRLLAAEVALKRARLSPGEIRFLRSYLGLSGADFARRMGVSPVTVSRWERKDAPMRMDVPVERLLRLMVLMEKPVDTYPAERLEETALEEPRTEPLRVKVSRAGWRRAA